MARWWHADGEDDAGGQTLETMPIGLIELDTDWTIRFVNAAAERMVGSVRTELLDRSYWDAFPANVDNEFGRAYRRAVATREPQTVRPSTPNR